VGNKSTGVVVLMFRSTSLVREPRKSWQNTELTDKTRQNRAHLATEAAIIGAIFAIMDDAEA